MSKIRARFIRGEQAKYISHLDLLRTFERALRRSALPITHSKGFNPHHDIVFGLPLSVGMTSIAEYIDFGLDIDLSPEEFLVRLNKQLPEGICLFAATRLTDGKNIMALINKASYDVMLNVDCDDFKTVVNDFVSQKEIIANKKTKSGIKPIDIKPMIFSIKAVEEGEDVCLKMKVSAGNTQNLNPQLVITALAAYAGLEIKVHKVHRTELEVAE